MSYHLSMSRTVVDSSLRKLQSPYEMSDCRRREGTWVQQEGGCYGRDHFSARLALPRL